MKRFIKIFALILVLIPCAVLLMACDRVKGKEYEYEKVYVDWAPNVFESYQEDYMEQYGCSSADEVLDVVTDIFVKKFYDSKIEFHKDGTVDFIDKDGVVERMRYKTENNTIVFYDKHLNNEITTLDGKLEDGYLVINIYENRHSYVKLIRSVYFKH